MNPTRRQFFGGLESLRGVAALMVVFFHMTPMWNNPFTSSVFVRNGYLMVDLFFVLSGFVICHSYGPKIQNPRDIARFMFLRFGRLYPLHLYMLVLFLGIETAKYIAEVKWGMVPHETRAFSFSSTTAFIANLFLVHPFFRTTNMTFNHPSWSIGVEFYTYVIFGVMVLLLPKRRNFLIGASLMALVALGLLRLFHANALGPDAGLCFLRCVLGFFIGVLTYHVYCRGGGWIVKWGGVASAGLIAALAVILACKPPLSCWDYMVLPLYAALILVTADEPTGVVTRVLNSTPLRWMGKISYSIYMVHLFVLMFLSRIMVFVGHKLTAILSHTTLKAPTIDFCLGFLFLFVAVALVLAMSHLTYKWIEAPYQKEFRGSAAKLFNARGGNGPEKIAA